MKAFTATLLLLSLVAHGKAQAQASSGQAQVPPTIHTGNIQTHGACSPVIVAPEKSITIECATVGLTPSEAKEQAKQYATILNSVRESGLKEDQILELVRQIARRITQISDAAMPRSISKVQRDELIKELQQVPDTNILIDAQAGDDNGSFANDFKALFTDDLRWKSAHIGYGLTPVATRGVYFLVSKEDNDAHTVPDGCVLTGEALLNMQFLDGIQALSPGQAVAPARGTCTLYISTRKPPESQ